MSEISTEDLYQFIVSNPRYLEMVRRLLRYGELPPEAGEGRFPNLERIAAEIKQEREEWEGKIDHRD